MVLAFDSTRAETFEHCLRCDFIFVIFFLLRFFSFLIFSNKLVQAGSMKSNYPDFKISNHFRWYEDVKRYAAPNSLILLVGLSNSQIYNNDK